MSRIIIGTIHPPPEAYVDLPNGIKILGPWFYLDEMRNILEFQDKPAFYEHQDDQIIGYVKRVFAPKEGQSFFVMIEIFEKHSIGKEIIPRIDSLELKHLSLRASFQGPTRAWRTSKHFPIEISVVEKPDIENSDILYIFNPKTKEVKWNNEFRMKHILMPAFSQFQSLVNTSSNMSTEQVTKPPQTEADKFWDFYKSKHPDGNYQAFMQEYDELTRNKQKHAEIIAQAQKIETDTIMSSMNHVLNDLPGFLSLINDRPELVEAHKDLGPKVTAWTEHVKKDNAYASEFSPTSGTMVMHGVCASLRSRVASDEVIMNTMKASFAQVVAENEALRKAQEHVVAASAATRTAPPPAANPDSSVDRQQLVSNAAFDQMWANAQAKAPKLTAVEGFLSPDQIRSGAYMDLLKKQRIG